MQGTCEEYVGKMRKKTGFKWLKTGLSTIWGFSCKNESELSNLPRHYNVLKVCRKIELEHHKGPCRCSCQESQTDCTTDQIWSNTNCQCQCPPSQGPAKYQCARDPLRHWDDLFCSCRCRNSVDCPPGQNMDQETCQCQQEKKVSQCSVSPLYSVTTTSQTARIATYVGLLAIAMVTVTILATLYLMATKKRPYRDFR